VQKSPNVAFELTVPKAGGLDAVATAPDRAPTEFPGAVVLVGNPNVGKSALFGALTNTYVTVSNYPGTTVELTRARSVIGSGRAVFVDTPGVLSLLPVSEDERVTRDLLLTEATHAILVVGDAKNLARTLSLALQVSELGRPFVVCLNMMDEAEAAGVRLDLASLERHLGVAVCATVAIRREGLPALRLALAAPRIGRARVVYPQAVEEALAEMEPLLAQSPVAPRALGLMAIAGDPGARALLAASTDPSDLARVQEILARVAARLPELPPYVIARARHEAAASLAAAAANLQEGVPARPAWVGALDRLTTHPRWGYALLALALYSTYLFVGVFGAGTLVKWLEDGLFGGLINPMATAFVASTVPWAWARDLARARAADRGDLLHRLQRSGGLRLSAAAGGDGEPFVPRDGAERQGRAPDGARARLRHDGDAHDARARDAAGAPDRDPAAGARRPVLRPALGDARSVAAALAGGAAALGGRRRERDLRRGAARRAGDPGVL
jgi:small GTP-binding protein